MIHISNKALPYTCPDCGISLTAFDCEGCGTSFSTINGVPVLFSRDPAYERVVQTAAFYDELYESQEHVWKSQGRTGEFIAYVSELITRAGGQRYLDLGCGEGYLLEAVTVKEKCGLDLSLAAVQKASERAQAAYCLGLAERLPYPSSYFDIVSSVGTMEHFLDETAATKEILRVLRPGGHYVVVLFVETTLTERIRIKSAEFLFPNFHPIALARWAWEKTMQPNSQSSGDGHEVQQPIQHHYKTKQARKFFKTNGLTVKEIITKRTHSEAPLAGHHMVAFVLQKPCPEAG